MTHYEPEGRDPDSDVERTDLAWDRSGLTILGCGALILRGVGRAPLPAKNVALGSFVLALGAATWLLGLWHARRVRRRGPRASTWRELAPISIGVALIGLSALLVGSVW